MPENFNEEEAYLQKAGILAEFGKVICISAGFFYKDKADRTCLRIKSISGNDEKKLLTEFIELANNFYSHKNRIQFAGHNIREFDVPFLCRRMVINQIPLPPFMHVHGAKPWEISMTDTLQWWKFGDYKNYISLHLLANILDISTSKDDIDGSMVQHVYYKENDLQRIVNYCQKDVVVVAQVLLRFKNLPLIEPENIFIAE
ncbi:ribonuclease H-like domain-containing protein [Segetibacter koreensis]|uniref:ribonuclease H-like domain-containing protein n=1 Tax=Segetibacter koreensis TaxID=398037 RepID=UPI00039F6487|nr:ribonuclease H-like domain-containing protein [Segetibacter koreensis]